MKKKLFYIASALTLMFIGLKLADKIDWSYWWVFSPVWIPVEFFVTFGIIRICVILYLYKHDETYRQILDDYKASREQSKRALADRLEEMKKLRQELLNPQKH